MVLSSRILGGGSLRAWSVVATAILALGAFLPSSVNAQGLPQRVSTGAKGASADCLSVEPALSADGRYVAFQSYASNLVANDTNGCSDVFVHDSVTGITTRVSVSSSGVQTDAYSGEPAISADGRFIAFRSDASNLVPNDTNGLADVFVHERITGRTYRVSTGRAGAQSNGASNSPSISRDGRYVAFDSDATNLVADDKNGLRDVFVRDRDELVTTRVSIGPAGEADAPSSAPSISGDGRLVAFASLAASFARETDFDSDVFVFDLKARRLALVSADAAGAAGGGDLPAISEDGSVVVFESAAALRPTDLNPDRDVYFHRLASGLTDVASVSSRGLPGRRWDVRPDDAPESRILADSMGASVSGDGRYVAFVSLARDLVDGHFAGAEVYVRDLVTGTTRRAGGGPVQAAPCDQDQVLGAVECAPVRARISSNGLCVGVQTRGAFVAADLDDQDDIYLVDLRPFDRSAHVKADRKPEEGARAR